MLPPPPLTRTPSSSTASASSSHAQCLVKIKDLFQIPSLGGIIFIFYHIVNSSCLVSSSAVWTVSTSNLRISLESCRPVLSAMCAIALLCLHHSVVLSSENGAGHVSRFYVI
eukprot:342045-Pleurochrysis_carterae.AAC.1